MSGSWASKSEFVVLMVHANIALYSMAFWFTQPLLPYISKDLGADPVIYGWLQTTFAAVQLIGGPIIGRVIDMKGPRFAMVLSHFSGGASYFLLSFANTVPLLFLSRVPTLGMHALHAAQAYVTLLSDDTSRAKALGRLSLSYGVGFILGPLLGGTLSSYFGHYGTAFFSGLLSIFTIGFTLLLPDLHANVEHTAAKPKNSNQFSWGEIFRLLSNPTVRGLLIVKAFAAMGISVFNSNFSLTAQQVFNVDAQTNGYIMSFVGVLTVLVNALFVGWITSIFAETVVIRGALVVLTGSLLFMSQVLDLKFLLAGLVPLCFSGTALSTVVTSALTKAVATADVGTIIGLDMAAGSACRVLAPTIAGYLFASFGYPSIGIVGALMSSTALLSSQVVLKSNHNSIKPMIVHSG